MKFVHRDRTEQEEGRSSIRLLAGPEAAWTSHGTSTPSRISTHFSRDPNLPIPTAASAPRRPGAFELADPGRFRLGAHQRQRYRQRRPDNRLRHEKRPQPCLPADAAVEDEVWAWIKGRCQPRAPTPRCFGLETYQLPRGPFLDSFRCADPLDSAVSPDMQARTHD